MAPFPDALNTSPSADNAALIQAEIDRTHENGGGRVTIPPGRWKTGSLRLRSNIELHLSHGCVLEAIDDRTVYPTDELIFRPALIVAAQAHNIALTGTGRLDGLGNSKRWGKDVDPDEFRFSLIRFVECREIKIQDVGIWWTRLWAVHLKRCQDVQIRGCDIIARRDRINADGIDPDDCQRVRISDCRVSTGDDAIVIKSTSKGLCEDILVEGCILDSSCAAIKIGTETTGTIRNVVFNNCIIRDSNIGISVYLKDGGVIRDIRMTHCQVEASKNFPILIDHTPRFYDESPAGSLEGVVIADCSIRAAGRLFIGGTADAPVHGVSLRDIDWFCTGPCPYGDDTDRPTGAARVREDPDRQPVGTTPHHIVLHNVHGCTIRNFRLFELGGDKSQRDFITSCDCENLDMA
mgnify:CR=1 FL=1